MSVQIIILQDSNWEYIQFRKEGGIDRTSLLPVLKTVFDFVLMTLYIFGGILEP